MNYTRQDIANATVYSLCNGDIKTGVSIDHKKLLKSGAKITTDGTHLDVEIDLDRDNPDIYKSKGHTLPADEVLQLSNTTEVKIPLKYRDEFPARQGLPSSEFLKAFHYYASDKFSSRKGTIRTMDETALLAFGLLAEHWIDQAIDESAQLFVEEKDEERDENEDEENEERENEDEENEENEEDSVDEDRGNNEDE